MLGRFEGTLPGIAARLRFNDTFRLLITALLSTRYASGHVGVIAPTLFTHCPSTQRVTGTDRRSVCRLVDSMDCPGTGTGRLTRVSQRLIRLFKNRIPRATSSLIGLTKIKQGATGIVHTI